MRWTGRRTSVALHLLLLVVVVLSACGASPSASPEAGAAPAVRRAPAPSSPLMTVGQWRERFDAASADLREENERLSRSTDSSDFYTLAYTIDELTSMLEATGDRRYAEQALGYVDNMIASARPSSSFAGSSFRDGFLGWISPSESDDEVALYESFCWRYVARLLRVLHQSPLGSEAGVADRVRQVQAFTETQIFDKWVSRGTDDYIYRSTTHTASHWAYIAMELARLTDDPVRRARYQQVVDNVDDNLPNYPSSLHAQMRPAPGDPEAYRWSDQWGRDDPAQDVGHGNAVVNYVVEANALGSGWTDRDMRALCNTLTSFVLGSPDRYPDRVDGTGRSNGWLADGFVKLGRFDPAIQAQLERYGVQNSQYYAAMAANARLLGAV